MPLVDEATLGITNPIGNAVAISPAEPDIAVVAGTDLDAGVHYYLWKADVGMGEALGAAIATTEWIYELAYNLGGSV